MIRYYVDEDLFLLEVSHSRTKPDFVDRNHNPGSPGDQDSGDSPNPGYDVTLIELPNPPIQLPPSPIAPTAHSHAHVHAHMHDAGNT